MGGSKKKSWNELEIAAFKKLILDRRDSLIEEMKTAKAKADEVIQNNSTNAIYSSHMADASSDQQQMEKNYYKILYFQSAILKRIGHLHSKNKN